jgi:nucleoside-diphosphate-sugar epimerase
MTNLKGKKIVVTGGAGFIGSHTVDALIERGAKVVVIDDLSSGKMENIVHHGKKIEFHKTDITDHDSLKKIFDGAYAVLHLAALSVVPRSIKHPFETNQINIGGTLSVFLAGKEAKVDRIVYASSSSVYGNTPTMPKVETMQPKPISPYAVQKYADELYANAYYALDGLKTIGLRYFNVFGPRQNPDSEYSAVIPKFIQMVKKGTNPTIFGDGTQARDFTYIENVVDANILAIGAEDGFGEVFNVGTGKQVSLNELVETLGKIMGNKISPQYLPVRVGDVKNSLSDISKARAKLGYRPAVSFKQGLEKTVKSYE